MEVIRSFRMLYMCVHSRVWTIAFILAGLNFLLLSYRVSNEDSNYYARSHTNIYGWNDTTDQQKGLTRTEDGRRSGPIQKRQHLHGISLANHVRRQCMKLENYPFEFWESFWVQHMHTLKAANTIYCPVEKIGTTFWRRVLYLHSHRGRYKHPYQVSINQALSQQYERVAVNRTSQLDGMFKFMFVRDPYHRLLSAYIDKVFVPNPMFWERFGQPAITKFRDGQTAGNEKKCFHDATFSEFLQFVAWSETTREQLDGHFQKSSEMCLACSMNFTFVGKMESFKDDAFDMLRHLNLGFAADSMEDTLYDLSADDAIRDSITSPFYWKHHVVRCMTWHEALQRVWRKLQLRGLIGIEHKFPVKSKDAIRTSKNDLINFALKARKASNTERLKLQKKEMFIEMYRSVHVGVLEQIRSAYMFDFYLFDYDDSPNIVFDRSSNYVFKNYSDFNKQDF